MQAVVILGADESSAGRRKFAAGCSLARVPRFHSHKKPSHRREVTFGIAYYTRIILTELLSLSLSLCFSLFSFLLSVCWTRPGTTAILFTVASPRNTDSYKPVPESFSSHRVAAYPLSALPRKRRGLEFVVHGVETKPPVPDMGLYTRLKYRAASHRQNVSVSTVLYGSTSRSSLYASLLSPFSLPARSRSFVVKIYVPWLMPDVKSGDRVGHGKSPPKNTNVPRSTGFRFSRECDTQPRLLEKIDLILLIGLFSVQ